MGWHAAAMLRSRTRLERTLLDFAPSRSRFAAVTGVQGQRASFTAAASASREPSLATNTTSSRYATPALDIPKHAPIPSTSVRPTRRSRESTSTARQAHAQEALAKIEATRGVVSPFLRDSFAREHDYLRIR